MKKNDQYPSKLPVTFTKFIIYFYKCIYGLPTNGSFYCPFSFYLHWKNINIQPRSQGPLTSFTLWYRGIRHWERVCIITRKNQPFSICNLTLLGSWNIYSCTWLFMLIKCHIAADSITRSFLKMGGLHLYYCVFCSIEKQTFLKICSYVKYDGLLLIDNTYSVVYVIL